MVAEILANLFQAVMFIGTLYAYFDKKYCKRTNYILLGIFVIIYFMFNNIYTIFGDIFDFNSPFIVLLIFETYTWIALKGNIFVRSIIPVIVYAINTLISYGFVAIVGLVTEYDFVEIATMSGYFRTICLVIVNITNLLAYIIFIKLRPKNLKVIKLTDALSFVVMPFLTVIVVHCATYLLIDASFNTRSVIQFGLIMLCMIFTDALVWKVMLEISKANELRTKYALMEQKEELYGQNIIKINEQVERTAHIKHDMKNNIRCIRELMLKDKEEALKYCDKLAGELKRVYTPINTKNILLNAIINVEQEKALDKGIEMDIVIHDEMMEFSNTHDIVSIIGNLCDNAIEYLAATDIEHKLVAIRIERMNEMVAIKCRNSIKESILGKNPELKTGKADDSEHGKGHHIVERNVKKYGGSVEYFEDEGYFCVQIVMGRANNRK